MIFTIFLLAFIAATLLAVGAILVLAITGALGRKSSPKSVRQMRLSRRLEWIVLLLALVWGLVIVWALALALPKG
jgi:multisubunit Na+/H+ antiporter MnhB subunit